MKKYTILLYILIFNTLNSFSQQSIQGTIRSSSSNAPQAEVYVTPTVTLNAPNLNNVVTMNISFSISNEGFGAAPVANVSMQAPFSTLAATPAPGSPQNLNGRYVYTYVITGNVPAQMFLMNIEYPIAFFSFAANPNFNNNYPRLRNDDSGGGTGQGYFYFELNGDDKTNYAQNFYGGTLLNDSDGVPAVEAATALPIKLKNFTADRFNNERASDLKWSSSSEVNADYFDVERSADGFNFEFIGKVKAAGNSNTEQNYSMLDRSIPNSRNQQDVFYYRLKMVDLDGQFEYSDVRSVRFDNESNIDVATYPNPTSGKLYVNISTPDYDETLSTDAFFYDLSGRLVMKKTVSTKGITEIDLDNVTNGAYNVSISHNGKSYQNRIIKTN